MPATTPKGYPYPLGTDRLADGDDAIHNLATAIDTKLPFAQFTAATAVVVTAAVTGAATLTFPAGLFTAAPVVNMTATGSSVWMAYATALSATSVSVGVRQVQGTSTTATVTTHVVAVQSLTTGPGLRADTQAGGGVATCHTEDCGNAEIGIDVGPPTLTVDDEEIPRGTVVCGVCGLEIPDVVDP